MAHSDNPFYSKTTNLPIFRTSDDKLIYGDPDKCRCCEVNSCSFCPGLTPDTISVVISGVTECGCYGSGPDPPHRSSELTVSPNGTHILTRTSPVSYPCRYRKYNLGTLDRYWWSEDYCEGDVTNHNGPYDINCQVDIQANIIWKVSLFAHNSVGYSIFRGESSSKSDCMDSAVVSNIWTSGDCTTVVPTYVVAHSGTVTINPL